MEGPARGCIAGLISWKLGGGLVSTIIIFVIVFWLLGYVKCQQLNHGGKISCRNLATRFWPGAFLCVHNGLKTPIEGEEIK